MELTHALYGFDGNLYGGGSDWGQFLKWTGSAWTSLVTIGSGDTIYCMVEHGGKLYESGVETYLREWDGSVTFTDKTTASGRSYLGQQNIFTIVEYNSKIYAGTVNNGYLFEWNDVDAWVKKADQLNSQTRINSLCVHNSKLYGGTYEITTGGKLFEWNGTNAWVEVADQLNGQTLITGLAVCNSELYGATSGGRLFKWGGAVEVESVSQPIGNGAGIRLRTNASNVPGE
jgi:hypothetical protein